ncbi:MAG: four helix bundle protein [Candidatus Moraniibacteriota bacterium]|nr:MAG: four helix bundle protein [Candidatus Moranbacteria bacterium]
MEQKHQVKKFEDLYAWQQSRELVKLVYQMCRTWKDYSLQDQIQRSAVSVLSNLAEGFERGTKDELIAFWYIARGSCGEVRAQLYVALDQDFIDQQTFDLVYDKADYTSRLIAKLIAGYKLNSYGGQRRADPEYQGKKDFDDYVRKLADQSRNIRKE